MIISLVTEIKDAVFSSYVLLDTLFLHSVACSVLCDTGGIGLGGGAS